VELTSNVHFPLTQHGCQVLRGRLVTVIISSLVHVISLSNSGTLGGTWLLHCVHVWLNIQLQ